MAMLFDCDGVLINSEAAAARVLRRWLRDVLPEDHIAPVINRARGQWAVRVVERELQRFGCQAERSWLEALDQDIDRVGEAEASPVEGVAAAVRSIPGTKAVVSNASSAWIRMAVHRTGLSDAFGDRLFSADAAGRDKPDPAVYRLAVVELGVAPDACIAVEDSRSGVIAAVKAGITVIGFAEEGPNALRAASDLKCAGAALVIHHMSQLAPMIEFDRLAHRLTTRAQSQSK
ncbi:hypothetical protein ABAZ39_13145 [Azospirillum argentinense]|uniref:HAD family phosphatase n=1 Tax=Azospirillum argentinense TaxID=2970906 RepID=A0A060DFJ5_9PROT|nr:HAD family phosphatase [Azospirillum argentinense]AIB12916.1 hypothetical protein ABAZ39_13145 [Azospirillum argentinense]EZQ02144.1 HAD family hydrolase [Azospirillum argentinense]